MKLFDTHCHLDFAAFDEDRNILLDVLDVKGVERLVIPAIGQENWQRVLDLAASRDSLFPALGIHPMFLEDVEVSALQQLSELVTKHREKVVAIGECGLDMSLENLDRQRVFFSEQLKLAEQVKLPVIVHHRKSHHLILPFLKKYRPSKGGVIHAFSGSYEQAMQYIDLGFKLGVGGTITYDRAQKTREAICKVPASALVLETDAPDMPIHGRQGMRNSPEYLGEIFAVLSLMTEIPGNELQAILWQNSCELFGLSQE